MPHERVSFFGCACMCELGRTLLPETFSWIDGICLAKPIVWPLLAFGVLGLNFVVVSFVDLIASRKNLATLNLWKGDISAFCPDMVT